MTKLLAEAAAHVRELSAAEQDRVARFVFALLEGPSEGSVER